MRAEKSFTLASFRKLKLEKLGIKYLIPMPASQDLTIKFRVSPFMNLYYSLEVATGSVKEAYNEEYAKRMKEIFPEDILERFARLSNCQRFSWLLKFCLSKEISQSKLEKTSYHSQESTISY